jgi:uncharacterized protein (UPF0332 family)
MPVLNPDHLLDQAERLIATTAAGGAPRQADLRRAVSAVYYGVFHAILTAATDVFVGKTHRDSARYELVYRSVSHSALSDVCREVVKTTLPAKYLKYQPRGGFGPELQAVAAAVIDLQQKRHLADYDPLYRVRTSEVESAIRIGREALSRFNSASAERRNAFVSLVVFTPR